MVIRFCTLPPIPVVLDNVISPVKEDVPETVKSPVVERLPSTVVLPFILHLKSLWNFATSVPSTSCIVLPSFAFVPVIRICGAFNIPVVVILLALIDPPKVAPPVHDKQFEVDNNELPI